MLCAKVDFWRGLNSILITQMFISHETTLMSLMSLKRLMTVRHYVACKQALRMGFLLSIQCNVATRSYLCEQLAKKIYLIPRQSAER